jgi:hypothetical protein
MLLRDGSLDLWMVDTGLVAIEASSGWLYGFLDGCYRFGAMMLQVLVAMVLRLGCFGATTICLLGFLLIPRPNV